MKIKIITIHDPDVNYGSTLQSCGTYNFCKQLGHDVEIIDYRPDYKSLKAKIRIIGGRMLYLSDYLKRKKKIENYFRLYATLTDRYHTFKELCDANLQADAFITGSDVIWNRSVNPEGGDDAFYLKFVHHGLKISYAPSMGQIQAKDDLDFLTSKISDFDFLSVREYASQKQLKQRGLSVEAVLDPVFLHSKEYYKEQIHENRYGSYAMAYFMSHSRQKIELVDECRKFLNLPIVSMGGFKDKTGAEIFLRDAGVEDFLSLIYYSDFIITDSFHCVSMAIILNKKFCYVRAIDSSLRIENILSITRLEDRMIKDSIGLKNAIQNDINYQLVYSRLESEITKSKSYLIKAINNGISQI